jgi:phage replication initiation protein
VSNNRPEGEESVLHPQEETPTSSPRTVIRGESSDYVIVDDATGTHSLFLPSRNKWEAGRLLELPASGAPGCAALTDWLNCTLVEAPNKDRLNEALQPILAILGHRFAPVVPLGHGLHGWREAHAFGETGAKLAIGGQHGTAFLSFSGEACSLISMAQWIELASFLRDRWGCRITRWDGAIDDFAGVHSVDSAVELFKAGLFSTGGRLPSVSQHGDWLTDSGSGRTFEIGKRKNGKLLRVYEKGMQLGCPSHPWVRWELELHNKDRDIPWEVLLDPGRLFAGAFPKALTWVSSEMSRIRTNRAVGIVSYERACEVASAQYGGLIQIMLQVEGDPALVVSKLARQRKPGRFSHPLYERPEDVCR